MVSINGTVSMLLVMVVGVSRMVDSNMSIGLGYI